MTTGVSSPKSSAPMINLCATQIQQISEKLERYEESLLENLDSCIANYVERRN
jgi:hypothetical protein